MNLFNIGLLNKENRIHGFSLAVDYAVSLAYIAENQGNCRYFCGFLAPFSANILIGHLYKIRFIIRTGILKTGSFEG